VILINLLPYREEKRKRRKTAFFVGLGVSVVLGAVVVGAGMLLLQQMTAAQASRNQFLTTEIDNSTARSRTLPTSRPRSNR
jgi:type IV pilus assembly protein PilN